MARLLLLVLAGCLACACGIARGASVDLRADERLGARLSLNEPMISVRRLLARVGTESHVALDAEPELRDETVCVCVKDQARGEVLDQVARGLGYRWIKAPSKSGGSAYRLVEDQDTRLQRLQLERRYRREAGRELVNQLDLLERFTRKLGGSAPRDVQDELERLQSLVLSLPTGPERLRAEQEYTAAQLSVEVERKPLLLALAALPPNAQERLIEGERLVMAVRRPGAIPMPEGVLRTLRAARQAQAQPASRDGEQPALGQTDEFIDFLSQVSWGDLTLYARSRRLPGQRRRLTFAVPTFVQTPSMVAYGPTPTDLRPGTVTADRPEQLQQPVSFTWPGKKLGHDQPLSYYTGVTVAEVLSRLAAADPRWQISGSAILEGLTPGAAASIPPLEAPEPVASLLSRLGEKGRSGALPLGELLAPLAQRGGVDIQVTRSGWIRFQSTRPFRVRSRQIDPSVLREVFEPVVEAPELTPEAALSAGRMLSREQIETLSTANLGFPRHLTQNSGLWHVVDAWRMLDRLTEPDRRALLEGATLRYATSNERGRTAIRDYIRSVSAKPLGAPLDLELGPRDLPALELSLAPAAQSVRVLELRLGRAEPPIFTAKLEADWKPRNAK